MDPIDALTLDFFAMQEEITDLERKTRDIKDCQESKLQALGDKIFGPNEKNGASKDRVIDGTHYRMTITSLRDPVTRNRAYKLEKVF